MTSITSQIIGGILLCLLQLLAALPWLFVVDRRGFIASLKRPLTWVVAIGGLLVSGALVALFVGQVQDPMRLSSWGRLFGAALNVQLTIDFFAITFPLLLWLWPHGAVVALAAF